MSSSSSSLKSTSISAGNNNINLYNHNNSIRNNSQPTQIQNNTDNISQHSSIPSKSSTITFIDRKKSKPVLSEFFNQFLKYLVYLNYKEEKITFRIVYDKIYRPELYNFIIKGSEKNINLTRNIFTMNEEKYSYELIKKNEEFTFDDDELYNENSYLRTVHKYFLVQKLTIYTSLPMCFITLYYKFIQNHSIKMFVSLVSLFVLMGVNMNNKNNQKNFEKKEVFRMAVEANKKYFDTYKNFFYDL
jgi:hypothetical protein